MPLHSIYPKLTSVDDIRELLVIPEDCEAFIMTLSSPNYPRVIFATPDLTDIFFEKVLNAFLINQRKVDSMDRSKLQREHFSERSKNAYWLLSEYELYCNRIYLHYFKDGEIIPIKAKGFLDA